jgi:hypothetical protein
VKKATTPEARSPAPPRPGSPLTRTPRMLCPGTRTSSCAAAEAPHYPQTQCHHFGEHRQRRQRGHPKGIGHGVRVRRLRVNQSQDQRPAGTRPPGASPARRRRRTRLFPARSALFFPRRPWEQFNHHWTQASIHPPSERGCSPNLAKSSPGVYACPLRVYVTGVTTRTGEEKER